MFTGLIAEIGRLSGVVREGDSARLTITTTFTELELGESIAVDGVCLTVAAVQPNAFEVFASKETLDRSTFGKKSTGARVNLERALRAGDRLGGHMVSGHVDGVGKLHSKVEVSGAWVLEFEAPRELAKFIAEKGSISINGTSLTVNAVTRDTFSVTIIPVTFEKTTIGELEVGGPVNLEVDLVARYVARAAEFADAKPAAASDVKMTELLSRSGYL